MKLYSIYDLLTLLIKLIKQRYFHIRQNKTVKKQDVKLTKCNIFQTRQNRLLLFLTNYNDNEQLLIINKEDRMYNSF